VKSLIASKYFDAWAMIITGPKSKEKAVAYVDLFAGPGAFEDGSDSTPILVIQSATRKSRLQRSVHSFFNDRDPTIVDLLRERVDRIDGVENLANKPRFGCHTVSPQIADKLSAFARMPAFVFADPFGYVGLSLDLLDKLLRNPKSETLIFFNTNRISPGLANPFVKPHIDALFGPDRAESVREEVANLHGLEREEAVLSSFEGSMRERGFAYVIRFRFVSSAQDRTSHHLVHCSRHPKGEELMKEIMAAHSRIRPDGVPEFEFKEAAIQGSLFDRETGYSEPPRELADVLLKAFAGRSLTINQIVREHSHGTRYVERSYREALLLLEQEGKISAEPPGLERPFRKGRRTWGAATRAAFPRR
jgi:three-Cys-motif partner protein